MRICVETHISRPLCASMRIAACACVYASARMIRHPVITIPLIDHPACVYASERIRSAVLAARRRVGSRRPYIWGRMRRRCLGALRRSQRRKRCRQRVQSGNRTPSAGYAADPSLMSGGDRNRSRLPLAFNLMIRRLVFPAVLAGAASVAGIACGAIAGRAADAPTIASAADRYALPLVACATVCAAFAGTAAAAAADAVQEPWA